MKQKEVKKIIKECRTKGTHSYKGYNFAIFGSDVYALLKKKIYNHYIFFLYAPGKKSTQCVAKNYRTGCTYYLDVCMDNHTIIKGRKSKQEEPGIVYAPYVLSDRIKVLDHADYDLTVPAKDVPSRYLDEPSGKVYYSGWTW